MTSSGPSRSYPASLAVTAVSYAVLHHLGLVPSGFGDGPDGTRWADWVDLAVPWLVLAPAAMTMRAADATTPEWVLFGAGAVAYSSGHGIHLAANSVGNNQPGQTAHLWDEVVGHYVWFAGVALVLLALALTMTRRPRPHPIGYLLAVAVGLTWASNAIGGGTLLLNLLVASAACAYGWRERRNLAGTLLVGYLPAVAILTIALSS